MKNNKINIRSLKIFIFAILIFSTLLIQTNAQEIKSDKLKITLLKITPKVNENGKIQSDRNGVVEEKPAEELQTVYLEVNELEGDIFARIVKQNFAKGEYFNFKIENHSSQNLYLNIFDFVEGKSCKISTLYPFRKGFGYEETLKIRTTLYEKRMLFRTTEDGEDNIIIIASTNSQYQKYYQDGLPLEELVRGMPGVEDTYQGILRGTASINLSGAIQGTAELGNADNSEEEKLLSVGYYTANLMLIKCDVHLAPKDSNRYLSIKNGERNLLVNRGLKNHQLSRYEDALSDYQEAIKLASGLQRIKILSNQAIVYESLNNSKEALKLYNLALDELRGLNDDRNEIRITEANIKNNLGILWELQGNYKLADNFYKEALTIEKQLGKDANIGVLLNNRARIALANRQKDLAINYFKQSLEYSDKAKNLINQASVYNNLGLIYLLDNDIEKAISNFLSAVRIYEQVGNKSATATAYGNLMYAISQQNKNPLAIIYGKRSVNILQDIRKSISSKASKKSFTQSRTETYRKLSNILISEGRFIEAQDVLDLLKEEEYENLISRRSGETSDTVPYSKAEETAIKEIENLTEYSRTRTELEKEKQQGNFSVEKQKQLDDIYKKIETANEAFRTALNALGKAENSVANRVDEIKGERSLQSTLGQLEKEVGTGVVALYTVIGTEEEKDEKGDPIKDKTRSKFGWVIMVTPTERKAYSINVENLNETVFQFRAALMSDQYDPQPLAQKLYNAIFRQTSDKQKQTLESDLQKHFAGQKNKLLMWSLDGVLRYVPMAALHDGKNYLVENYANTVFTKASQTHLPKQNEKTWQALGLGVSEKLPNESFNALPGVKTELETIVRQKDSPAGIINGEILLNNGFKEADALRLWREGKFPVIHIASHYSFNEDPEKAFLLVGDGRLTFAELQDKDNLFGKVDVLTLSACDTAVTANGKEAEGFAYLAQDLGAKSVIASLWQVSDAGTPELMIRFYKMRTEHPEMSKAEAFRRAQLEMMGVEVEKAGTSGVRSDPVELDDKAVKLADYKKDPKRPYAHPHYWASFVMIGNWR